MAINPIRPIITPQFGELPTLSPSFATDLAALGQITQAQQLREQYATDLQNTINNPTQQAWAAMIAKYPSQHEAFGAAAKTFSEEQKANEFWQGAEISTALENGNADVAKERLSTIIEANKNANRPYGTYQQILDAIDGGNVKGAQAITNMTLSILDPTKFKDMVAARTAIPKAEAELTEKQAVAQKAAVDANYAESKAAMDLAKSGWDIYKIAEDATIAKENQKIAALNARLQRETNDLRKQELQAKLVEMSDKRDEVLRTKTADLESSRASMDNMLNTADRILQTPIGVVESATGPVSSRLPTVSEDTANFEELVNTLGSQAFMAQVPSLKGMGALSDAEGKKLTAALQNFNLRQSSSQLLGNVREAQRLILKARKNLAEKYGAPETLPNTPAVVPTPTDIDSLLKKYGGQ